MEEQIRKDLFVNWRTHFVWFVALVTAVVMMLFYRVLLGIVRTRPRTAWRSRNYLLERFELMDMTSSLSVGDNVDIMLKF